MWIGLKRSTCNFRCQISWLRTSFACSKGILRGNHTAQDENRRLSSVERLTECFRQLDDQAVGQRNGTGMQLGEADQVAANLFIDMPATHTPNAGAKLLHVVDVYVLARVSLGYGRLRTALAQRSKPRLSMLVWGYLAIPSDEIRPLRVLQIDQEVPDPRDRPISVFVRVKFCRVVFGDSESVCNSNCATAAGPRVCSPSRVQSQRMWKGPLIQDMLVLRLPDSVVIERERIRAFLRRRKPIHVTLQLGRIKSAHV